MTSETKVKTGWSRARLLELYAKTGGKAWEPPRLDSPALLDLIELGYVKRCTMRCGFEAFDTGVNWTEAGHKALGYMAGAEG